MMQAPFLASISDGLPNLGPQPSLTITPNADIQQDVCRAVWQHMLTVLLRAKEHIIPGNEAASVLVWSQVCSTAWPCN